MTVLNLSQPVTPLSRPLPLKGGEAFFSPSPLAGEGLGRGGKRTNNAEFFAS